jgi:hypothetical protein
MVKDSRKRSKPTPSKGKKQVTAAKQSAKKKQKQGLKYRNADLRAALDSQTQEMFAVSILNICLFCHLLMARACR